MFSNSEPNLVNNEVNCSRIRNDWFGIGSWRRRSQLAWHVLRSLFLFSRTLLLPPSDFGLPGIGFKPSFILSGRPSVRVRPRPSNVLVRGQLFSSRHSVAGGEGRTKTKERNGAAFNAELCKRCSLAAIWSLPPSPSPIHPPAFHSVVSTLKQNEHHYFTAVRI